MTGQTDKEALDCLLRGKAPAQSAVLKQITTGLDSLTDFLHRHYLSNYIPEGGSKIKFVTGRSGSGKTHLAQCLLAESSAMGFLTVAVSAKEVWLHDFR